jgi:urocanate hydratase
LHAKLEPLFREELATYGHIYMFPYLPRVHPEALPFDMIPGRTNEARAMIHMILNNLDPKVA